VAATAVVALRAQIGQRLLGLGAELADAAAAQIRVEPRYVARRLPVGPFLAGHGREQVLRPVAVGAAPARGQIRRQLGGVVAGTPEQARSPRIALGVEPLSRLDGEGTSGTRGEELLQRRLAARRDALHRLARAALIAELWTE